MYKASIAIFGPKKGTYESSPYETKPVVPEEIFRAAKRVIENKGCELVKVQGGLYVVKYSETGPMKTQISNDWLPLYVARVEEWRSGGITRFEMDQFETLKAAE